MRRLLAAAVLSLAVAAARSEDKPKADASPAQQADAKKPQAEPAKAPSKDAKADKAGAKAEPQKPCEPVKPCPID